MPWGPPQAPQSGGAATKWILGGVVLVVVVVITIVATVFFTRGDSEPVPSRALTPAATAPPETSNIASASDHGPIEIITADPTCAAWTPIGDTFATQALDGWSDRDPSIPASDWTPEQRQQHESIAAAMRSAADQTVNLVRATPHRVMRELYEQTIAYWRAYADKVPDYVPTDDHLARVATSASNSLTWICSSITYGSAAARAPLTVASPAPLNIAPIGNPSFPTQFVEEPLAVCQEFNSAVDTFDQQTSSWIATDPNLPIGEWPPEQRAIWTAVSSVMSSYANKIQDLGIRSKNPVFNDFAALAAQYRRAFVQSFPSYVPADGHLANAAANLVATNNQACEAAGAK